ncbi:transposase [Nocardia sp. CA-084685]|uniref:transposase n=1 Tax=Nocardia sp. CA-084685 TaxID=3239970 RepID=UPI003D97E4A6
MCFQDESRFSLLPAVRATWAPRGVTPVLRHRFSWKSMSMSGVLAYRPDRSEAAFVFAMKEAAYNTETLIEFLTELHRHFDGEPVILVWAGLTQVLISSTGLDEPHHAWSGPVRRNRTRPRCIASDLGKSHQKCEILVGRIE